MRKKISESPKHRTNLNLSVSNSSAKGEVTALLSEMGKTLQRGKTRYRTDSKRSSLPHRRSDKGEKEQLREAELKKKLEEERVDVTLAGKEIPVGKQHPLNMVLEEFEDAFVSMGFSVVSGPEVEFDRYNFENSTFPNTTPQEIHRTRSISTPKFCSERRLRPFRSERWKSSSLPSE